MIVTISNQKGGVGKTTTAAKLAGTAGTAAPARTRHRQRPAVRAHPSSRCRGTLARRQPGRRPRRPRRRARSDRPRRPRHWPNRRRPDTRRRRNEPRRRTGPRTVPDRRARTLTGEYDDIVIDTPPNLGLLTVNALVIAELVIAPVSAEDDASLHGIRELRRTLHKLTDRLSATQPALMPVLTRSQPLRISSRVIEHALTVESLRPAVRVPARSALFARAAAACVPLAVIAPDSAPTLAYDLLAQRITEVIAR